MWFPWMDDPVAYLNEEDYSDDFDPFRRDDEFFVPSQPFCKFCKKQNLKWITIDKKWRLAEQSGVIHKCNIRFKKR